MEKLKVISSTVSEKSMNTCAPQKTPNRRSKRSIRINSKATATPGNGVGWFNGFRIKKNGLGTCTC